jgi:predicted RNase H-like nuclease (RuvC/YqgF family)
MNFAVLERENRDLKEQIGMLTEQLEFLTLELKSEGRSSSFGKLEEKIQELTSEKKKGDKKAPKVEENMKNAKKIAALALGLVVGQHQKGVVHGIFSLWKFWIYKKSKLQEELEVKVTHK